MPRRAVGPGDHRPGRPGSRACLGAALVGSGGGGPTVGWSSWRRRCALIVGACFPAWLVVRLGLGRRLFLPGRVGRVPARDRVRARRSPTRRVTALPPGDEDDPAVNWSTSWLIFGVRPGGRPSSSGLPSSSPCTAMRRRRGAAGRARGRRCRHRRQRGRPTSSPTASTSSVTIPSGLPKFQLPSASGPDIRHLLPVAVGVFLVGFADSILTARSYAGKHDQHVDATRSWVALGVANIASGRDVGLHPRRERVPHGT